MALPRCIRLGRLFPGHPEDPEWRRSRGAGSRTGRPQMKPETDEEIRTKAKQALLARLQREANDIQEDLNALHASWQGISKPSLDQLYTYLEAYAKLDERMNEIARQLGKL